MSRVECGFIKPNGVFIQVDFGDHIYWAREYVKTHGLQLEYDNWYENSKENITTFLESDFLVYNKNWAMIHGHPSQPHISCDWFNITNAQIKYITDTYINANMINRLEFFNHSLKARNKNFP